MLPTASGLASCLAFIFVKGMTDAVDQIGVWSPPCLISWFFILYLVKV